MPINEKEFASELSRVFKENGFASMLSMDKSRKFFKLTEIMLEENEKYNLTAITDMEGIILKHYADCAILAAKLKHGASVADIGCGAGFPTLPLAILRDDLNILAIDSTAKRISYVEMAAKELSLRNVKAIAMRAEDGASNPDFREKFDYATARAVANMRILSELCLPYVKYGGEFVAMKGKNGYFELAEAKRALSMLGGSDARLEAAVLKNRGETEERTIITVLKKQKTPSQYPRPYSQITKKPL